MSYSAKVLWGEGLFLRPQHFQRQDAYHEDRLAEMARVLHPYAWGLRSARFDASALANGMLRATEMSAVFPDGELYSAPHGDELPPPVALTALDGVTEAVFYLAIHPLKAIGGNYRDAQATGSFDSRYTHSNTPAPDLYTGAASAELAFLRKDVRLISEFEPRDELLAIPVARVRRTASASYELDTTFVAPSLSLTASGALHELLRRLLDALQAKVNALYGFHREPSKNIIEFRSGDVASFWLLHTANEAYATLSHLFHHPQLHPERLFQELARLAGALMTFSKVHTLADLPVYRHDAPGPAFARMDEILRDLLETVISTRYFSIVLEELRPSFHMGRLDSEKLDETTSLYLAVQAAMPAAELSESVPMRFKVGAPEDVDKLVLSAMPGVPLSYTPQVPPAVPVKPGAVYFALQTRGSLYDRMLQARSIAIYAPAGIPELKLDLIAVTR
ncbi:type VI secretion system baseplate subunit TssK [Achromobacter spanius]|uniref:Type VI secretion system baseplate subunit TssK n=1 Tax=Achromobacter spanius TaxID=217203 RepID=A0A2S0I2X7_9BURK|nr:type VI secretion system baseplate subunit TssK [Achromobacter spanius]AVJ26358.1 type VI secretion system baseplate subunit TssK [Achromobacter spanius]